MRFIELFVGAALRGRPSVEFARWGGHGGPPLQLLLNLLDQPQGVVAGDEGDVFVSAEFLQKLEQLTRIGERLAV